MANYDWVVRMRTDLVLLKPLNLPQTTDTVYVPGGGMSARSWLRCSNDHLFICPRALCTPYATLLDNFNTSDCTPLEGFSSGGDGVLPDGTLRPPPAKLSFSWHLSRAYNASQNASCGRVREIGAIYAIARGDAVEGGLTCENSLRFMWRKEAEKMVTPAVRACAMEACFRLSRRFGGGDSTPAHWLRKNSTDGGGLDMFALERRVFQMEARQGMHEG